MSASAQIGGAAPQAILYAMNKTGAAIKAGACVQYDVVDGDGDGYEVTGVVLDAAKPESFVARRGIVHAAEGPLQASTEYQDGANIPLIVEGFSTLVNVDANSPTVDPGDMLIAVNGSADLVKSTNTDFAVDGLTAVALTDSSGGTASQTIAAVSGSGADAGINNNFASIADDLNKLLTDVTALRSNIESLVDLRKTVAVAHKAATADNTTVSATIIKL